MSKQENSKMKEIVQDVAKSILMWIVVTIGAFFYWMALLLLISLMAVNVWRVTFEDILQYVIVLTIITSFAYIGTLLYRKLK